MSRAKHVLLLIWFEGPTLCTRAFDTREAAVEAAGELEAPFYITACAVEQ